MPILAFPGMIGSGSFVTDQRPKNWREMILKLYPNGMAPLTALMAMLKSEKTDDPEFNWWTKALPTQNVTPTGVYTDVLVTAYAGGGVAADVLYIKMALADVKNFTFGHVILFRDASDVTNQVVGRVSAAPVQNGASSYITVTLLEDDDNGTGTDIQNTDSIAIIGTSHEEGADRQAAVSYQPTKIYNYTQIFRNSLAMTRTAKKTRLRTGEQYKEAKREALELHSMEMEKSFFFGIPTENTGAKGFPIRTTGGIKWFIDNYASANKKNYVVDHVGTTWLTNGELWLENFLEQLFRVGSAERLAYCGSGALLGIQRLVQNSGQYQLNGKEMAYGIKVVEWITPFGTVYFKTHPLFSNDALLRNEMCFIDTDKIVNRVLDDTFFKADKSEKESTGTGRDGMEEEFVTEMGLELHHSECFGWASNVGIDG